MKMLDIIVVKSAKILKNYCQKRNCNQCIFYRQKLDGESYYCEFDCLVPEDWNISRK